MKKVLSAILSVVLLLSCISTITFASYAAPAQLEVPGNYMLADENANIALYVDKNTGDFAIMNQKTGVTWYSTPIDWQSDAIAQGDARADLTSKLLVNYITSDYTSKSITSNSASVITERVGKDWVITFYFSDAIANFSIPVKLSLKKDYVHVELMIDKINEMGDSRILLVQLFPYFGAANLNDTGYMFLPDGTGSLMELNRELLNTYAFGAEGEGIMFAPNPTEVASNNHFTNWNEALRLPVYGMVKNGDAFMTVIEKGAAVSEIHAYLSRLYNSYNTIYSRIIVRDTQVRSTATGQSGATGDKADGYYYSDHKPENYIARYYVLDGENANYFGMAERYRNYLIEEHGMTPVKDVASNALNITLYGAIKRQKHFLGIPYTGSEALTTYSEVEELVDRLNKDKIDKVFISYSGWNKGGLENTTQTSLVTNKILGNKTELNSLIEKVNGISNYSLAFDLELQRYYKQNSDIRKYRDLAHGLDSAPVNIMKTRISAAGTRDGRYIMHQMIHPGHMPTLANDFINSALSRNVNSFSFNSIGDSLYCAYNMYDECTRDESAAKMTDLYQLANEAAGETGIVSTQGGNGYAAPYVDNIVEAPVSNSHNVLTSQEVPFYQIVFRGYVNLAGSAMNLDSEKDDLALKLAETGMSLYYELIDADSTSFHNTTYTSLFACELDAHYDDMVACYKRLAPVYKAIGNSSIANFEIVSDDVRITTFSNGVQVYTNYSDAPTVVNGVEIGAKDFTVNGGVSA